MTVMVLLSRAEGFAQFLTAILMFLFVLAITYFTTRFVGNYQKSRYAYRNFDSIEVFKIANGKYLQLVKIGKKYVVLGIGKDSVSMVCEIPEEDVRKQEEQGTITKDTFKVLFEKARGFSGERDDSHDE